MTRVLVTGGTGVLGRKVVHELLGANYTVRVMSRNARSANAPAAVEWAQADLATGEGVADAAKDAPIIVHAATLNALNTKLNLGELLSHPTRVDVHGTRQLLEAARAAPVAHFIYVSIVGIERIPYSYYKRKVEAEQLVRAGSEPWTILRATQFHQLMDGALSWLSRWPILPLPTDFQFQLLDPAEVAVRLRECVAGQPAGLLPDVGGPEVKSLGELARAWLAARGLRRRVVHWPLMGGVANGFRKGYNTCPQQTYGKVTWEAWLARRHGSQP